MTPPTDDVSLVRSYYERFNSGDWEGMCALMTDDVQHDLNQGAREIGRAAFRAFLDKMARSYQEQLHDICVMGNGGGGRVAAEYIVVGTYLADDPGLPQAAGQRYRIPGGAFFAVENGRIARVTNYYNLEDWLAQIRAWPTP
jgi:steroid delta-isomerase-like uncharacterized protein